jgi:hypothetical protein
MEGVHTPRDIVETEGCPLYHPNSPFQQVEKQYQFNCLPILACPQHHGSVISSGDSDIKEPPYYKEHL